MTVLAERASAKINLTLEVRGRRPDGYHELQSLVVFALDASDSLSATPGAGPGVAVKGPFATAIAGANLVDAALMRLRTEAPWLAPFSVTLEKYLPVASGIGGGSADAAAALRLARRIDAAGTSGVDLTRLAQSLGADVPVCLLSRATMMSGIGERLEPVALPQGLAVVVVNTLAEMPADKTAQVFQALAAGPVMETMPPAVRPVFRDTADVLAFVHASENSLQPVASEMFPAVATVLEVLSEDSRCRLARLSGAGPTCFGLYDSIVDAKAVAASLKLAYPDWWIVPSRIS